MVFLLHSDYRDEVVNRSSEAVKSKRDVNTFTEKRTYFGNCFSEGLLESTSTTPTVTSA